MKNICLAIHGGAKVHALRKRPKKIWLLLVLLLAAPLLSSSAYAQGSIFGLVTNANATVPANGQISFFGYLDNTDEEIHIETSIGAGYDAGNWYDDFQNYLTEAPGNPYDYHFFNATNSQGFVLSKSIPNNSFQQEDIALAAVSWPAAVAGLSGRALSSTQVVVSWNRISGVTYHVYRRPALSTGSFFRIDDPSGSLANPGVADSFFVDNGVDGVSEYNYLVVPQNGSGTLGPHSNVITVNSSAIQSPVVIDIAPDTGFTVGGQSVTITGSNFDKNGATATIDGALLTSITVVSPYLITGLTPIGTPGPADIVVTNTASGLASAPLVGGFYYKGNTPPVLNAIGPKSVAEGATLNFGVTASDVDGTIPSLTTSTLPTHATFVDNGNGTGTFNFNPDFTQAGLYPVTFYASDAIAVDSEVVAITVTNTNQAPILAAIGNKTVAEGATLNFGVSAADADGTIPALTTSTLPTNATFVDNGNGTGTFNFNPSYTQAGAYPVTFFASDGAALDSELITITVTNTNREPVLDPIGNRSVAEGANLNFGVSATDPDATIPALTTSTLPANATFVDNGNGSGTFNFNPNYIQSNAYPVTFYASDGTAIDSEVVTITVTNTNRPPVLDPIGPKTVAEGGNLNFAPTASDPDATIPALTTSTLPTNATFVDNGNGSGTFNFNPDFTQEGSYPVTFFASDGSAVDSEIVTITVTHVNQPPVLAAIGPKLVAEGANLNFGVSASDGDGTIPTLTTSTLPANATFVDNGSGAGTFDFNPDFTQGGIYNITFYAGDGQATDSEVVAITVNDAGNQAPILNPIGPRAVNENENLNFSVTATDPDLTTPSLTTRTLPLGAVFIDNGNGSGTFDFTPDYTQAGVFNVTFVASDGFLTDSEIVVITVTDVNRPPVLDPIGPRAVNEGVNLNFTVAANDPDGTIPVLTTSTLPAHATFVNNGNGTGTFDFNPDFTQSGVYDITFYANDGTAIDSEVVAITVTEGGNQPPVLNPIGPQVVYETATLNLPVTASDPDGTTPSLSALNVPANATFTDNLNGTGTFIFTPSYTQAGDYSVTFKAFDGVAVDSEVVVITVLNTNRAPILDPIGPRAVTEGGTITFGSTASDADGTTPTLTTSTLPANATFIDNLNGSGIFTFTPDFTQSGIYPITFYAGDGTVVDSEVVTITVADAGNQRPVIDSIPDHIASEGANLNFQVTATDPDNTIPALSAVNLPVNATFVDNLNGSGAFSFTPDFSQAGAYEVTFIASDGVLADSEQVLITVRELGNQAPVIVTVGPQTVNEGDTLIINLTATDPEGQTLTFNYSTSSPMRGITLVDNLNGTAVFTYIPDFLSAGIDTVRVFATDNGTPRLSDVEVIEITTYDVNQPPVIDSIGPFGVRVGKTLEFAVTAHDTTDQGSGQIYLTVNNLPANATFVDSGNGTGVFRFTPASGQVGVLTMRFIAIDNGVPPMSDQLDVQITIVATNRPPVLADIGPKMILEGQTLAFGVSATDPDGTIPALTANKLPSNSSFVDNGNGTGTFTFTPNFVQAGLYGVEFRASDGFDVVKKTVLIQVLEAGNQRPSIAVSGDQQGTEDILLQFTASATDPDGTIPSLAASPLPGGATFVDSGNGVGLFSWKPTFTQAGDYYLDFVASDGALADSELVHIQIFQGPNQPPAILPIADKTQAENTAVKIKVTTTDPDSVPPILTTSPLPGSATFVDNHDFTGDFNWQTTYGDSGTYDITFYATDPDSADLVATEAVRIVITNVNRSPVVFAFPPSQPSSVSEGATLVYTVRGADEDGDPPILTMTPTITNFTFVDNGAGSGTLTISPNYTQAGSYNIKFFAQDGARDPGGQLLYPNARDSISQNFSVTNVPVPPILDPVGARSVVEGQYLQFYVTATHPGGQSFQIFAQNLPAGAAFIGIGNARLFSFTPAYTQAGVYTVLFYVSDGVMADSEFVPITVIEAGNQAPYFESTFPDTMIIAYGDSVIHHVVAHDPDLNPLVLTLLSPPANVTFVDSGNGAGSMKFKPDPTQVWKMYNFRYIATDPFARADTLFKWVRVVAFMRGDSNTDGKVDIADITFIISYVFRGGPEPVSDVTADVNNDATIDITDALYLVNYIFRSGPPPPDTGP